jgi:hypothetical protein
MFPESLKSSVEACAGQRLRVSTVRHCASRHKSFFECLIDQKGFQGHYQSDSTHREYPAHRRYGAAAAGLGGVERHTCAPVQFVRNGRATSRYPEMRRLTLIYCGSFDCC